jgi:hypothetical protein
MRCGGDLRGLCTVKAIGELIEGIAGRAGLKNVREVGERMTKSERLLDAAGSDLLDYGQTVIAGLKSTTGEGAPENGEAFGHAQSMFDGVNQTLKSAVPIGWDGSGSYTYADQNTRQQLRSQAMADADHEVHKVLYREAAQITLRRGYLDDQYNFLANTSYVTLPLQFIPRYGEAMKLAVEIAALQTALGESYYQVSRLQSEVAQNAAELQQAVGRYSGVADGAQLPRAPVNFDPSTPPDEHELPGAAPIERSQGSVTPDAPPSTGVNPAVTRDETTEPRPQPVAGGPQKPVTARLDSENPPGPPAGTPAQDQR